MPLLSLQLSGRVLLVLTSCKRNHRLKTMCCRTRFGRVLYLARMRNGLRRIGSLSYIFTINAAVQQAWRTQSDTEWNRRINRWLTVPTLANCCPKPHLSTFHHPYPSKNKILRTHAEYLADILGIFLPAIPTGPQLPLRREPSLGGHTVSSRGYEGISRWYLLRTVARAVHVAMQASGTHTLPGSSTTWWQLHPLHRHQPFQQQE